MPETVLMPATALGVRRVTTFYDWFDCTSMKVKINLIYYLVDPYLKLYNKVKFKVNLNSLFSLKESVSNQRRSMHVLLLVYVQFIYVLFVLFSTQRW